MGVNCFRRVDFIGALCLQCCHLERVPLVSLFLGKSESKVCRENSSPSTRVLVLCDQLALCFGVSLISGTKFFMWGRL